MQLNVQPVTHFLSETAARRVADRCQADDTEWTYEVVMTPRNTFVIAVIDDHHEFIGFL